MNTTSKLKTGLLAAAITAATLPVAAFAALTEGDIVGTSEADIRAALAAEGYVVHEIETEDGEIEVEATRDGKTYEVELSSDTGAILEIEVDDDDD